MELKEQIWIGRRSGIRLTEERASAVAGSGESRRGDSIRKAMAVTAGMPSVLSFFFIDAAMMRPCKFAVFVVASAIVGFSRLRSARCTLPARVRVLL
jgi:hypothetical protein